MKAEEILSHVRRLPVVRPLLERRYERYFATAENANLFRGVYASYAEALASAPPTKGTSFDQPAGPDQYKERIHSVWPSDYPVLFWLKSLGDGVRSVFDLGGHVGLKYYSFSRFLAFPEDLRWTVCEVPSIARGGEELAKQRGAGALRFVTDVVEANAHDFMLCSGVLQFFEPSLSDMLEPLPRKPKHVIVNTTPLWDGPTFYTLHSTGWSFAPYKAENSDDFLRGMKRIGYELVDKWDNPGKACTVPFHPERSVNGYRGVYLRLEP